MNKRPIHVLLYGFSSIIARKGALKRAWTEITQVFDVILEGRNCFYLEQNNHLWFLDSIRLNPYWVNPSKRWGMDGVFRGLAGLLRGISQGQSQREILRSSPASPRKTSSIPTLLLGFTFYLKKDMLVTFQIFFKYWCLKKHNSC